MISISSLKIIKLGLVIFLNMIVFSESANILYIIPFTGKSHYIMLKPIGYELARRGHNVTVITSFIETDAPPGYNQILVDDQTGAQDKSTFGAGNDGKRLNIFDTVDVAISTLVNRFILKAGLTLTEHFLKSKQVQELLAKDNQFDIVINEIFNQEAFYMLAHKYNAPLVLITTFGNCMKHNIITRNPLQLVNSVYEWGDIEQPTSLFGRIKNFYLIMYDYWVWRLWNLPEHEELARKYIPNIPQPAPSLYEIQKETALFLTNSHFSFDTAQANLPNIVEIGGAHLIRSENKLPKDLQKILDEAPYGVVYFSMGSNAKSCELPPEKRKAIINTFRGLKETVLWKFEDDSLLDSEKPDNIITRKWFPQKEIQAHPNVKVFITHGGFIGLLEAMFNGVPILGIPLFADQANNLLQVQELGFGKRVRYHDIEGEFKKTLKELLKNNRKYKEKAVEVARRFQDRPMTPLDTAMFWIEFTIRNKGGEFMKNPARHYNWFIANMYDIMALILIVFTVIIYVVVKLLMAVKYVLYPKKVTGGKKKRQ